MFKINQEYAKTDIYTILNIPIDRQKGQWNTGSCKYNDDLFIFANIGTAGRSGDDHGNYWDQDKLVWFGKDSSNQNQSTIQMMASGNTNVYLFYRDDSSKKFTYKGLGRALSVEDNNPVKIVWTFINPDKKPSEQIQAIEGIDDIYKAYKEGGSKKKSIEIYNRSLLARQKCIELKGTICCICGFDFEKVYGSIGSGYIHIHHIKQLSETKEAYLIDPEKDLIPVCPNCHAMIHRGSPVISTEKLKSLLLKRE